MPFKSRKQFIYLKLHEPKVWAEWKSKYGVPAKVRQQLHRKKS